MIKRSIIGGLVHELTELLAGEFSEAQVSFTPRICNRVAHELAWQGYVKKTWFMVLVIYQILFMYWWPVIYLPDKVNGITCGSHKKGIIGGHPS